MNQTKFIKFLISISVLLSFSVQAEVEMKIKKITDNVYALVGEFSQRSPDNYANNSTHGVIITNKGVILVDPGGSYKGGQQIANLIKTITPLPVRYVINTGGQDHRWLGNGYFKDHGATIISSKNAFNDHKKGTDNHMNTLSRLLGDDGLAGTVPTYADITFDNQKTLDFGGVHLEIYHTGAAHTVGDSFVWMPSTKTMFSGDIVFVGRLLGIGPARDSQSWIKVFEDMAKYKPNHIVPGHGDVTNIHKATQDTYNYLVFLREKVSEVLDDGGDMQDAIKIDQSQFSHLANYEGFSKRVAQSLFEQMEFEE